MSLVSSLVLCAGPWLVTPAPEEPPAEPPAAAPPSEPSAPTIPPPSALRPQLAAPPRPLSSQPAPAPAFVVAAPTATKPPRHRARLPRGWALDLAGGTSFPISVGAGLQLETPFRLLTQVDVGAMPGAYTDVIDALAGRMRRSPAAGDLARDATHRALVVRAALGVRPLARRGLEVRGGYTGCALGRSVTSLAAIESITGADLGGALDQRQVPVQSTVHNIHADLGYRWIVRGDLVIRTALGYAQSLGARLSAAYDASVSPDLRTRTDAALGTVAERGASTAIRSPYLTVQVGYRF